MGDMDNGRDYTTGIRAVRKLRLSLMRLLLTEEDGHLFHVNERSGTGSVVCGGEKPMPVLVIQPEQAIWGQR